jgi:membrane-associated phospholipid phosphatase
VGLTRIYVGAHLPLDVAGGAALGLVIDAALTLASARTGLRLDADCGLTGLRGRDWVLQRHADDQEIQCRMRV